MNITIDQENDLAYLTIAPERDFPLALNQVMIDDAQALFDTDGEWVGIALSGFGIPPLAQGLVYNRFVIKQEVDALTILFTDKAAHSESINFQAILDVFEKTGSLYGIEMLYIATPKITYLQDLVIKEM
ncbi:hypothetical protein [Shouchella patagoniensis]|uniref:hypothetical protein n=1 Tax=Shouchella patagoniensis TaxID=228576 RepID=UPI0009950585|nr:hypothetical protein [Shouchella patagoniensis]